MRRLLEAHPDWRAARIELAKYYESVDRLEDALDTIAEIPDDEADVMVLRCEWLIRQGRIQEAGAKLDEALALHPQISTLCDMAASLKKFEPGDPLIARMEDLLDGQDTQRKPDRAELHFALGKTYEDIGQYDKAFEQFELANKTEPWARNWSVKDGIRQESQLRETLDGLDPERIADQNPATLSPVFVTGLPRSGTTLTERIIGNHDATTPVGECAWLKGNVRTLSVTQVRKPIYQSSQRIWQRYGDRLKPLIDALEKRNVPLKSQRDAFSCRKTL